MLPVNKTLFENLYKPRTYERSIISIVRKSNRLHESAPGGTVQGFYQAGHSTLPAATSLINCALPGRDSLPFRPFVFGSATALVTSQFLCFYPSVYPLPNPKSPSCHCLITQQLPSFIFLSHHCSKSSCPCLPLECRPQLQWRVRPTTCWQGRVWVPSFQQDSKIPVVKAQIKECTA